MLIKDDAYQFKIFYVEKGKDEETKILYSDSDEIYELEDVPKETFCIFVFHKNLKKGQSWNLTRQYWIGDEITLEEAEEEMKALENLQVVKDDTTAKMRAYYRLESFYTNNKNETQIKSADNIYLNKNIELKEGVINARIIIIPKSMDCEIISPKQIVNGKIYRDEKEIVKDVHLDENIRKIDSDNPYIDLE